ncbi:MAG: type II secretion system GspH family protein [Acidobacteria bacterium]|nr:type II secretion system GspH family protein [Acidobacteriota bacterium]
MTIKSAAGWTLIELVITMTVMAVLAMAVIPIVRTSVRRQRELRLREILREMRGAIDEFHRDTVGMQCAAGGIGVPVGPPVNPNQPNNNPNAVPIDPRSRVYISDCTIFGVDNPERYPPSLETLVEGVDVLPRASAAANQFGSVDTSRGGATANTAPVPKKKKYLREIPVDPMTGRAEWCLLSQYDEADSGCSSNPPSLFDVRSKSDTTALNGKEKYSEW